MLWRVRTTMSDRPGSLATLARRCGDREVNILGMQIFPDIGGVTDELVLHSPPGWSLSDVAALVESAGGREVRVATCTEHALVDGPTRYLQAVRQLVDGQYPVAEVIAHLLDAELADEPGAAVHDTLGVEIGAEYVEVHRLAPFTPTEHARATALAEIADLVAPSASGPHAPPWPDPQSEPVVRPASLDDLAAVQRMHQRCSAEAVYHRFSVPLLRINDRLARRLIGEEGDTLVAAVGREVVAMANLTRRGEEAAELSLIVEDSWQRRGIGNRLLSASARAAAEDGSQELVLRGRSDNRSLLALVTSSGLRSRVRLSGETVVASVLLGNVPTRRGAGTPPAMTPTDGVPAQT